MNLQLTNGFWALARIGGGMLSFIVSLLVAVLV